MNFEIIKTQICALGKFLKINLSSLFGSTHVSWTWATYLVVEWSNVYLQGRESTQKMEGPFTFQAILHNNGDIVFAYKTIPIKIELIADEELSLIHI